MYKENNRNVVVVVVEKENNRNVVAAVVVVVGKNNGILWAANLYQCGTFYLFLSLHSAREELT